MHLSDDEANSIFRNQFSILNAPSFGMVICIRRDPQQNLLKHSEKRETLEKAARQKLQNVIITLNDVNKEVRENTNHFRWCPLYTLAINIEYFSLLQRNFTIGDRTARDCDGAAHVRRPQEPKHPRTRRHPQRRGPAEGRAHRSADEPEQDGDGGQGAARRRNGGAAGDARGAAVPHSDPGLGPLPGPGAGAPIGGGEQGSIFK